jgi:RNA-directed DNA polymerase
VKRYLRYVDDLALFGDDKYALRAWRLRLNEGKSRVRRLKEGIEFLGFVVLPDRVRLNARNVRNQRQRMGRLAWGLQRGAVSLEDARRSMNAWSAHAMHGDTSGLRRSILLSLGKPASLHAASSGQLG